MKKIKFHYVYVLEFFKTFFLNIKYLGSFFRWTIEILEKEVKQMNFTILTLKYMKEFG